MRLCTNQRKKEDQDRLQDITSNLSPEYGSETRKRPENSSRFIKRTFSLIRPPAHKDEGKWLGWCNVKKIPHHKLRSKKGYLKLNKKEARIRDSRRLFAPSRRKDCSGLMCLHGAHGPAVPLARPEKKSERTKRAIARGRKSKKEGITSISGNSS